MICNLPPQACGYLKDGCTYSGKCFHQGIHSLLPEPQALPEEITAKQQAIKDATIRDFEDGEIFFSDEETTCKKHNVKTIPAGAGLWPCPECLRERRNGKVVEREISLPYKDEEPPEISENTEDCPF